MLPTGWMRHAVRFVWVYMVVCMLVEGFGVWGGVIAGRPAGHEISDATDPLNHALILPQTHTNYSHAINTAVWSAPPRAPGVQRPRRSGLRTRSPKGKQATCSMTGLDLGVQVGLDPSGF